MKENVFITMARMNVQQPDSLHAYLSNNLQDVKAGKNGWGSVQVAITTGDAQAIMNDIFANKSTKIVMLIVADRKVFDDMRTDEEANAEDEP